MISSLSLTILLFMRNSCCVLLLLFVPEAHSFCPFAGAALRHGQRVQRAESQRRADLITDGYVIDAGQPASIIWGMFAQDNATISLYERSVALLQAQRFYVDGVDRRRFKRGGNATNDCAIGVTALLRQLKAAVPLADRCRPQPPKCRPTSERFARIDGSCYDLRVPTVGSANAPYSRLLPAYFDDGIYAVRVSRRLRSALPSPRLIGNVALQHSVYSPQPTVVPNHGSLIFGQYITHDGGFKDVYQNAAGRSGLRCCAADNSRGPLPVSIAYDHCMAASVPLDDPFYAKFGGGCLDYIRSQPVFGDQCDRLAAAEIASSVTQHLDHSTIYGSTVAAVTAVRAYRAGLLLNSPNRLFPRHANCTGDFCYFTGDVRGAFYPTLSLWHSIFIRLHNQIAERLAVINRHWADERLFQESRRLTTAVYHNIVFNEWLPPYIGHKAAQRRHVSGKSRSHYDPQANGASMQEFSSGVFRVFHANTPDDINMYDREYLLLRHLPLNESIHGPNVLEREFLTVMRGFFHDPITLGAYPENVRNTVFNNDNANGIGLDLLSVDVLRGRDHGLAPYHVYLESYWREFGSASERRLSRTGVQDWHDLSGIFSQRSIDRMRKVYDSVHDVDLLVGLLLEQKRGTLLGPVGVWLMEEQFYRYKFGNRFHYLHMDGGYPMTDAQVQAVNRMGFGEVLCWCSDIEATPRRVFEVLSVSNPLQKCSSNSYILDLDLWYEEQSE